MTSTQSLCVTSSCGLYREFVCSPCAGFSRDSGLFPQSKHGLNVRLTGKSELATDARWIKSSKCTERG